MAEDTTVHCCEDMRTFTRTRDDIEKSGILSGSGLNPSDLPEPLVKFHPALGVYVIGYAHISYCPWCGSELPRFSLEKSAENSITISVDKDGNIYWNDEQVRDQDELMARLQGQKSIHVARKIGDSPVADPESSLPSAIGLGLDLEGGSYLSLELDMQAAINARLESLCADIRSQFDGKRVRNAEFHLNQGSVVVQIKDGAQIDAARDILRELSSQHVMPDTYGAPQFDLVDNNGKFTLQMTKAYRRQIGCEMIAQSIEAVRRRVDPTRD